jgi:hypothetical protein
VLAYENSIYACLGRIYRFPASLWTSTEGSGIFHQFGPGSLRASNSPQPIRRVFDGIGAPAE